MSATGNAIAAARPRVIGALAAQLRDLDLAEDAFAAATEKLLRLDEMPGDIAAWLYVAGRRSALDVLRRRKSEERALADPVAFDSDSMAEIVAFPDPIPDERLRLVFICCHPALGKEARVALTLRIVCGVPTEAIARAFIVSEATMYQRLTRAKAKIGQAGIPFETPDRRHWADRLEAVLATLDVAHSVAYRDAAHGGPDPDLAPEVEWLALMLAELLPREGEVAGLAAIVLLARARSAARVDDTGALVPLTRQDPRLWDVERIAQARALLEIPLAQGTVAGPHRLAALIHLAHCTRAPGEEPPWPAIAALYDKLAGMRGDPVVAINRAVAIGRAVDAATGLAALAGIDAERMEGFLPFHVASADLHARAGHRGEAVRHWESALAASPGEAERRYIERRLAEAG